MDFSHLPRLENDLIVAWHWPRPPDEPPFKSLPRFAPRNLAHEPLASGASVVGYHSAGNFIRMLGSIACDQLVRVECHMSHDEVAPDGHYVTNRNIAELNYDVPVLDRKYEKTDGIFFPRNGRWIRVRVTNLGEKTAAYLRCYIRGSVL